MSKIRNIVMAGALAFAAAVPVTAEAGPVSVPMKIEKSSDVTNVRYCGRWRCWRGGRRWWGPRVVIAPRRIWVAPRRIYVAPRVIVRSGYNAHVSWCLNRYASYDPGSNTFLSYDGYRKRCISPY